MKLEKTKDVLYKTILIVLMVFVTYVTYCSIFKIYRAKEELKSIVIIIGVITLIFALIRSKKIISKIPKEKSNIIAIIICIVFLILLITAGVLVTSVPTYDLSSVVRESQLMMQNNGQFTDNSYFSVYTNQYPLALLIYYIYSLGHVLGISNLRIFATIVNALFICITAFFTYLSVKKLENHKLGLTTLLFFVLNPILYIYVSYYYSDTLCMPFSAVSIYLFISASKCEDNKKKIVLALSGGLILAIGFKIRVVLIFILIAMIVGAFLNLNKKYKIGLFSVMVGFIIGIIITSSVQKIANPKVKEELKLPITHWIMMGLNLENNGRYLDKDVAYTKSYGTYSEKVNANIAKIKERIEEAGASKLMELFVNKLSGTWSNGDYDYISKFRNVEEISSLYEYIAGNKKIFILYYSQIFKVALLVMYLLSVYREYREKQGKYKVLNISIFGAFIFYLIWETEGRYSLSFLPWMVLLFGIGIEEAEDIVNIRSIQIQNLKIKMINNVEKIVDTCIKAIFIITIILLAINFPEYTMKRSLKTDDVAMQKATSGTSVKVSNRIIKQTFKASRKFNIVAISFENINKGITNYKFILKNEKGNILKEQDFKSSDITHNKNKTFYLDEIKPKKEQTYTIEISSPDATDNNSIAINTYYLKGYSGYEKGDMYINDEKSEADFCFTVANENNRPYVSKKVYIIMSAGIILLEIFAFYPYIKPKKFNLIKKKK